MYYSVQASLCKHLIAEDAVPVGDSQLAGQDQRFSVIPVIDYLLEVVLLLAFETFHSEVIYDEQVQMLDLFKELEFVALECKKQVFDQQFSEKLDSADFGKLVLHIVIDKAVMRQRAAASLLGA